MLLVDDGGKAIAKHDVVARPQTPGAFGKSAPGAAAEVAVERDLDHRLAAPADQPRRDHLGIVEDEQIARAQQFRQIRYMPVLEPSCCGDEQQAGGVARLARV